MKVFSGNPRPRRQKGLPSEEASFVLAALCNCILWGERRAGQLGDKHAAGRELFAGIPRPELADSGPLARVLLRKTRIVNRAQRVLTMIHTPQMRFLGY